MEKSEVEQIKISRETLRSALETTKKKLLIDAYTSLVAALIVSCVAVMTLFQREGWLISRLFVNEQIYMLIGGFFVSYGAMLFVHTASTLQKVSKLTECSCLVAR